MLNVYEILTDLVDQMFTRGRSYHGRPLTSLRPLVDVEGDRQAGRVMVPYWWPVHQYGRGRRKTNKTKWRDFQGVQMSTFQMAIYRWMQKNRRFTADTDKGKINEAKGLAWYINKFGNKHFRDGAYIDIYDTLVNQTVNDVRTRIGGEAMKIMSELVNIEP